MNSIDSGIYIFLLFTKNVLFVNINVTSAIVKSISLQSFYKDTLSIFLTLTIEIFDIFNGFCLKEQYTGFF